MKMIQEGALDEIEAIFAAHVSHEHPTSIISSVPGSILAGCGFFRGVITKSTSGANPILAGSASVVALQTLVSREADPLDPQLVSVTSFQSATTALHQIPGSAAIAGTFRAFSVATFRRLRRRIEQVESPFFVFFQGFSASLSSSARVSSYSSFASRVSSFSSSSKLSSYSSSSFRDSNYDDWKIAGDRGAG